MSIDLKKALGRKLPPKNDKFVFETPGDQLIFRFVGQRTEKVENREAEVVDADVLAGEKIDPETKKVINVAPGRMVFFLQTHLKRIYKSEKPIAGDVIQQQLVAIRSDLRNMKEFAFEYLEKVPRPDNAEPTASAEAVEVDDDHDDALDEFDDIPNFPVPKAKKK
jgi:hypothetical protein